MQKEILCASFLLLVCSARTQTDSLRTRRSLPDTAASYNIPIFSISGGDAESDLGEQDVSSLLQSSRDLFTQYASFQFGSASFRMRGYAAENFLVMINGVSVNNPETGVASWSSWGGLNDVTRFTETRVGSGANPYAFSGPGGYTNIDAGASTSKKSTRFSYVNASRVFRHRTMLTHATGFMKNNWALTISLSDRRGSEVYIPGTSFEAQSLYLAIDKRINAKHLVSLTAFAAPVKKALSAAATAEAYQLSNDAYYNSLWGFQNKALRNSAISQNSRPLILLAHTYSPTQKKKVTSSLYYTFGKASISGLNFNDAPNPRPDYYKYLPSYFYQLGDTQTGDALKKSWEEDGNIRQIDWDKLIAMNRANLYSEPGQPVNTIETRARYILENRVEQLKQGGFNFLFNERRDNLFLSLGIQGSMYRSNKYKEMEDILGASFWIDVDQFAQNLGPDPMIQQNDLSRPNRKVYTGDKFGYDYSIHIQRAEAWAQAEYTLKRIDFYGAISIANNRLWRTGHVANGKFPGSSKGESVKLHFLNYGFKGGLTYKLNGRNFITAHVAILTRAPEAANSFISPSVRNDVVDDLKNEEVLSSELTYHAKYPSLKMRFTVYSTHVNNQTWLRTYYDDNYNTLVNMIMTQVNTAHEGVELGLEKTFLSAHSLQVVTGVAASYYTNRPKLQAWQDNNATPLYEDRKVYLKNYRVGSSPQFVSAVGYRYSGRKFWSAGICLNYFDKIYIESNPNRRTVESAGKFQADEKELSEKITAQSSLPSYYLLNASVSKTFRLRRKYNLNLNLSVNNLLNATDHLVGGYEQLRWDAQNPERFPDKYRYMAGRTYMFIVSFSF